MNQTRPRLPGAHSPVEGLGNKRKSPGRATRVMMGGTHRTVGAPVPRSSGKASRRRRHLRCVLKDVFEWLRQVRRTSHVAGGRNTSSVGLQGGSSVHRAEGRCQLFSNPSEGVPTVSNRGARLLPPLASPGRVPALPRLASDRLSEFPPIFCKMALTVVPTSPGHYEGLIR